MTEKWVGPYRSRTAWESGLFKFPCFESFILRNLYATFDFCLLECIMVVTSTNDNLKKTVSGDNIIIWKFLLKFLNSCKVPRSASFLFFSFSSFFSLLEILRVSVHGIASSSGWDGRTPFFLWYSQRISGIWVIFHPLFPISHHITAL